MSQRESASNNNIVDPLDSVFNHKIFRNQAVNPFLEDEIIAYHNVGIEKSINFVISYVFFMNFEGRCADFAKLWDLEFGQRVDLFEEKLEKFARDTKDEKSRFELVSFKMEN